MSNKNRIIIAVVAVVVIVIGVGWYMMATSKKTSAPAASDNTGASQTNKSSDIASTITYDGSSFSVSNEKVKAGSNIKVVNNSSSELNFDSDPHPVHTDNTELNAGSIAAGQSKTFTVTKVGTWGFHNHLDASQRGTITVE